LLSKKHLFPLLAFAIPLLIRVIPEVLMGPYPVGFDTTGYYVPTTLLWLRGGVDLSSFIATAPLLYSFIAGVAAVGAPIFLVLKVASPLLLGFLGLAIYSYARLGLTWSSLKSLVPALVGTLYFMALRISWDALRVELALIFVFVTLTAMANIESKRESWKSYTVISLGLIAVVLANQVVAILMLSIVAFTLTYSIIRRHFTNAGKLVAFSLPSVVVFFACFFLSPAISEYRLIFGFPSTNDGWLALFGYPSYPAMLASEAGFFLYCFLPLLPLILLSLRHFKSFQMRSWLVLIFLASFIPMVSPSVMRLIMLLTYPFAFYVADGLSRLRTVKWRKFKTSLLRLGTVYLVVSTAILSAGFILMPPEAPFPYFRSANDVGLNNFIYHIPSSMLQNTVSITHCKDVTNAINWYKGNASENAVLLTHRVFFGWALSAMNQSQIVLYEFDKPENAATAIAQVGQNHIYLIWWINGHGWDGQPTVNSAFRQIYQSGEIAIYSYTISNVTQS
jgi:hypothetical protein